MVHLWLPLPNKTRRQFRNEQRPNSVSWVKTAMIAIPFKNIDKGTIEGLLADREAESKTLDYKECLPKNSDKEVKEFLADVSSFANAAGGDLIFGISEERDASGQKTGRPGQALGVEGTTGDQAKLRLDSMIRDGIAPRIFGIQVAAVDGFPKGPVIIVRIPRSWSGPHMVTKGDSRFFSRTSSGKGFLDVQEIRAAFALSEALPERIRNYRAERLSRIATGEGPIQMAGDAVFVLHLVPYSAFEPGASVPFTNVADAPLKMPPIGMGSWSDRINVDGYLAHDARADGGDGMAYTQLFRNGIIEAVNHRLLRERDAGRKFIPGIAYEEQLIAAFKKYVALQRELAIQPPIVVMLSLLSVKGFTMSANHSFADCMRPIDRSSLLLPEVILEDYGATPEQVLRPVFDSVWQACGFRRCLNYTEQGEWRGAR